MISFTLVAFPLRFFMTVVLIRLLSRGENFEVRTTHSPLPSHIVRLYVVRRVEVRYVHEFAPIIDARDCALLTKYLTHTVLLLINYLHIYDMQLKTKYKSHTPSEVWLLV